RFDKLPKGPLLDRLMFVFRGLFEMYAEHPKVAEAFVKNFPGAKGPNAQRVATVTFGLLHRLSMLVADAQRSGEVAAELPPLACAQNVFGLYLLALLDWLNGHAT